MSHYRRGSRAYHKGRKTSGVLTAIIAILIFLFFIATPYYKYLPNGVSGSIIAYILIVVFFISSLIAINNISGWESDLKTWSMYIFSFILFILSIFVYFSTAFVPFRAASYNTFFAIALFLLSLFALFRARRRTGIFVYRGR